MQNSEVPYVRYLDWSDREDVRLLPLCCVNSSVAGLRGYVDKHSPLSLLCITMILRMRRKILKLLRSPIVFAGDDGVSVPLTGLARFGAAGSVSGAVGATFVGSSVFGP